MTTYYRDRDFDLEYLRFSLVKVALFFSAILVLGVAVVCSEIAWAYIAEYWHLIPRDPSSLLPWRDDRVIFLVHPVLQIVGSIVSVICWFHIVITGWDINDGHHRYRNDQIRKVAASFDRG